MLTDYISATIDNHIFQGNKLKLDPRQIVWRRVLPDGTVIGVG